MTSKHSYPTRLKIKHLQSTLEGRREEGAGEGRRVIQMMTKDAKSTLKFANRPGRTSDSRLSQMYN